MLGCIGLDTFGEKQTESLIKAGVDTRHLKRSQEQPTGTAVIYVNSRGDNNIVVIAGANAECDTAYLEENKELFEWCDYLILQMEIPYESVLHAARMAKKAGKTVILNPAPAPESLSEELCRLVDYLTPNETELMKLSGIGDCKEESLRNGAARLLERGIGCIIVTLGEKGALLLRKEEEYFCPARKVNAIDTTAAGDCFNGAFAVALAEGKNEREALYFANTASSLAVTRSGAQASLPDREELEACLEAERGEGEKI